MDRSLSLVLPVRNAATTLAERVDQLLELLPELTERFEVLIVDDASTDHTAEIAWDLAREFPQVRVVSHEGQGDSSRAVQNGVGQSTGDVAFVFEQHTAIQASELRRMWDAPHQPPAPTRSAARTPRHPRLASLIYQLKQWGQAVTATYRAPESEDTGGADEPNEHVVQPSRKRKAVDA